MNKEKDFACLVTVVRSIYSLHDVWLVIHLGKIKVTRSKTKYISSYISSALSKRRVNTIYTNKIRDLFKVKLYIIRSKTKRELSLIHI